MIALRWQSARTRSLVLSGSRTVEHGATVCGLAALACVALGLVGLQDWIDAQVATAPQQWAMTAAGEPGRTTGTRTDTRTGMSTTAGAETTVGGYLGVMHTHRSTVTIKNADRTDMTVSGFDWIALPFKSPIYYGLRAIRWGESGRIGAMLDFTHAKAIANFKDVGTFTGRYEGKPLPATAPVGDVFKHLEFSHGHNFVTLNGIMRLGILPLQPYVGAGAGVSLPHTEIGFRAEPGRTYEYQYAGLTGQVLAGLELRLGRTTVFVEYKLSYSPYDVPLSGVVNGGWLFGDLWRQFRAWMSGEAPPGGRLTTPLLTHHGIGGVMVRASSTAAAK